MESQGLISQDYRSIGWLLGVCLNACLSSFCLGFFLVYLSTLRVNDILSKYNIFISSEQLTESLVTGCVPVGAIIGALCTSPILNFFSRKNCFLVTNLIVIISIAFLFFKNPITIIIGRLLQGICTGIYSAIVPLFINEIATPQTSNLGTLNQIFIAFGESFAFFLYWLLTQPFGLSDNEAWIYLFCFPLILICVQSVLMLTIYSYETPKYLQNHGSIQQFKIHIELIYHQNKVLQKLEQWGKTSLIDSSIKHKTIKTPKLAVFAAIHLAMLQQMTGVNIVAVYGGKIVTKTLPEFGKIIPIIANLLPCLVAFLTLRLMKNFGRKCFLQMGTAITIISLTMITIGYFVQQQSTLSTSLIITSLILFMTNFGLTLGPIVWLYIPEIVQANIIPFSTMTNLSGAAFCIIIFPIALKVLPNTAYLFLFFLCWNIVSLFINNFVVVETKNQSKQFVRSEYENKWKSKSADRLE